jgi:hypothetical protein
MITSYLIEERYLLLFKEIQIIKNQHILLKSSQDIFINFIKKATTLANEEFQHDYQHCISLYNPYGCEMTTGIYQSKLLIELIDRVGWQYYYRVSIETSNPSIKSKIKINQYIALNSWLKSDHPLPGRALSNIYYH